MHGEIRALCEAGIAVGHDQEYLKYVVRRVNSRLGEMKRRGVEEVKSPRVTEAVEMLAEDMEPPAEWADERELLRVGVATPEHWRTPIGPNGAKHRDLGYGQGARQRALLENHRQAAGVELELPRFHGRLVSGVDGVRCFFFCPVSSR